VAEDIHTSQVGREDAADHRGKAHQDLKEDKGGDTQAEGAHHEEGTLNDPAHWIKATMIKEKRKSSSR
jgi:hypothetical protein